MRAYGFRRAGGPENEAFLDVPVPEPGEGELRVAVRAAGVNPGDWKLRDGSYGVAGPAVLGREVAGTVVAVGPGIPETSGTGGFAVGDEVFGGCPGMVGGWAEQALVTAGFAARRPEQVAPEQAAVLPVAAGTAADALVALDLPEGATLLVNGAGGGVGVALVQLARARGLHVVGTAGPAKHAMLTRLGARPVAYGDTPGPAGIPSQGGPVGLGSPGGPGGPGSPVGQGGPPSLGSTVVDRIAEAAPDGVDAVFDLVGGDPLRTVATLLGDPSRLISVADKDLAASLGGRELVRDRSTAVLADLAARVADGTLDPHVTDVRPLDDAAAALALVEHGHATGKVVLTVP